MLGRSEELERLRDLIERARSGMSGTVLVHGEPGVGKSALLDATAGHATAIGLTVLRTTGIASESTMAWASLAELTRPVLDGLASLPAPQAAALAGALAVGPPAPADRFTIGAATVSLLAAAAERSPILVIVDDMQWIDADSADALLFAARRLSAEGVALVLAIRDGTDHPFDLAWIEHLPIAPLPPDVARSLLERSSPGPLSEAVTTAVLSAARGNALALVSLPRLLTDDQRCGRVSLPEHLPVPRSFERDMADRLRRLPERTAAALTVAAAHAGGGLTSLAAALATLDLDLDDLEPAERLGVVRLGEGDIAFEHPLLRSAAYLAASAPTRRAAHLALAQVLRDEDALEARARHLASATVVVDENVAACLERAAGQAGSRGALTVAADLAAKASSFSPDPADRARRRVDAAELALLGGRLSLATAMLDDVIEVSDLSLRIRAAQLRGRLHVLAGGSRSGVSTLVTVAEEATTDDPAGAALLYVHAAAATLASGRHAEAGGLIARAAGLAGDAEPIAALVEMITVAANVAAGAGHDGARLLELYEVLDDDTRLSAGQPALLAAAAALIWLEDFDRADQLVDAVLATARRRFAVSLVPLALVHRSWVLIRRARVAAAAAAASEAKELAEATGQDSVVLVAKQQLAQIALLGGRPDEARTWALEVRAATEGRRITPLRYNATLALGYTEMTAGRFELAVTLLEEIVHSDSATPFFRNPAAFGAANHLIEAYLRVGRDDDARRLLEQFADAAAGLIQPWPRGQVARLRGLLEDDYDRHFADALELLEPTASAVVWARVSWAERLRAEGRRAEAREQLHAAFSLARQIGYHGHTTQILTALADLGEPAVGGPDDLGRLSGQELAVATAVAAGATIPEAAAELFLSTQTVEHDLTAACRRLGVTSPEDLAARLAGNAVAPGEQGWFVTVLGRCQVRRDGVDMPVPAGRAGVLLQLLAAVGGRATLDEVIEHLWPEADADTGRTRIRNVLARLRQSVGGLVRREGDMLAFDDDVEVDAACFLTEAGAAITDANHDRAAAAKQAVAALRWYGGPLLPEAAYEPWAEGPRQRVHARYLGLLDLLAAHAEDQGAWDDAARYFELAVEADPYDLDRTVAAAHARLQQGRRSRAVQLARQVRRVADELGVPPPPELDRVEAAAGPSKAG